MHRGAGWKCAARTLRARACKWHTSMHVGLTMCAVCSHFAYIECSTHAICSCGRVQTHATCVHAAFKKGMRVHVCAGFL